MWWLLGHVMVVGLCFDCGCWLMWWLFNYGMIYCWVMSKKLLGWTLTSVSSCLWAMRSSKGVPAVAYNFNVTLHQSYLTQWILYSFRIKCFFFVKRLSDWKLCWQNVKIRSNQTRNEFSSWQWTEMLWPSRLRKRWMNWRSLKYAIPQFKVVYYDLLWFLVSKVNLCFKKVWLEEVLEITLEMSTCLTPPPWYLNLFGCPITIVPVLSLE